MNWLVSTFTSEGLATLVYGAMALALLVMALAPRPIRLRLRTAVLLGLLFVVAKLVFDRLRGSGADSDDIAALIAAVGAVAVARVAFVVVVDVAVERMGRSPMNVLVRDVLQVAAYALVGVATLRAANMRAGSILATGTVISAVVGLSLQETLGNLFAGIAIQLEKPVDEGEWIRLDKGDVLGRVVTMNWRSVTIETDDAARFVIPNGVFSRTAFTNHSRPGGSTRRSLTLVLPFDVPPARAHEAMLAACADCPDVLSTPAPSVLTTVFGERGVTYWLRYWIRDFSRRDPIGSEVTTRVWYQLSRRKIAHAITPSNVYQYRMNAKALREREVLVVQDRRAAIEVVDFLKPLSEESKTQLAERGHRKLYAAGETILREGDTGRTLGIVRRGLVSARVHETEVGQLGPGEFFGELALLTGEKRTATVLALQETEVFEIDEQMFREVIQHEPGVAAEVSRIVGERQAELEAVQSIHTRRPTRDAQTLTQEILEKVKEMFALD